MDYTARLETFIKAGGSTQNVTDRVVFIDGLNLFIRNFQANPLMNDNGEHVGGVYGFFNAIKNLIREFDPNQVFVVLDGKGGSTRRKRMYSEYKARRVNVRSFNRPDIFRDMIDEKESMAKQLGLTLTCVEYLPVRILSIDNIEADDSIAFCVKQLFPAETMKIIVSTDKDFFQLIDKKTSVYLPDKRKLLSDTDMYKHTGYRPLNYLTLRCFTGDVSDNITGVKQIGKGTLNKYFSLNNSGSFVGYEDIVKKSKELISEGRKEKVFSTIVSQEEIAKRNYDLMQLQQVDIAASLKMQIKNVVDSECPKLDVASLHKILLDNGVSKALNDLMTWGKLFSKLE